MFLVYGLQKSGISITKLLEKKNLQYKIWDDNKKVRDNLKNKFTKNFFSNPAKNNLNNFEKIYVTPGISLKQKKFNLLKKTSKINRDLNLYTSYISNQKIIAITGTNGKSTTTKLVGDILKKNKISTFVGGNIGRPLCSSIISKLKYKYHVIELSSFQLETVNNINSNISIITNLANDHLDRYDSITDYINQKKKIITNSGINLISIDDKYSKKIFQNRKLKNKISFSIYSKLADIYMGDNYILDNYFKNSKKLHITNISKDLAEHFNKQNILIAYACCKLLKLPENIFKNVIKKYKGLPFRSSIIFNNRNLKVINNSKSTNLNSTVNSIKNYNNIYLIMGGLAKEKNFNIIANYKNRIVCVYIFGKSSLLIDKKIRKSLNTKIFKNLKSLIKQLFKDIKDKDFKKNILFAPACTSFDQYKNFEERGIEFTKFIKEELNKL